MVVDFPAPLGLRKPLHSRVLTFTLLFAKTFTRKIGYVIIKPANSNFGDEDMTLEEKLARRQRLAL